MLAEIFVLIVSCEVVTCDRAWTWPWTGACMMNAHVHDIVSKLRIIHPAKKSETNKSLTNSFCNTNNIDIYIVNTTDLSLNLV